MKTSSYILSLLALFTLCASCDIRDRVAKKVPRSGDPLIDVGKSYAGFKVGTTEDELIEKLGPPPTYSRLSNKITMAVYNNSTGYLFSDGKLVGIRIASTLLDFQTLNVIKGSKSLNPTPTWQITNGIRNNMALPEVQEILGERLRSTEKPFFNYHQIYEEDGNVVHLYFSKRTGKGVEPEFIVNSLLVVPASFR